jgi:hypothetical protein
MTDRGIHHADPSVHDGALPADAVVSFPNRTPHEARRRLTNDLERWGDLFVRVAREDKVEAAEQILGGLVDWMGNGLIDGWLWLPIPLFARISDLAEDAVR